MPEVPTARSAGPLRIVIADDHPIVREGIRRLVTAEADMQLVGEADNGERALQVALETQPDVLIMDLSMPVLGGAELAARLRESCPDVRVLVLTFHEESSYVSQLLRAGAGGYMLKRTAPGELITAIRIVANGTQYIDPALQSTVAAAFVASESASARPKAALSEREYAVLHRVARGFSNKEIAAALDLSVKTVETYKARAAEKLGLRSRVDVIRYAARNGWLEPTADD